MGRAGAFDARNLDRCAEEPGAFHPDANDPKPHGIAGRHFLSLRLGVRIEEDRSSAKRPACRCRAHLEEFASREIALGHSDLLWHRLRSVVSCEWPPAENIVSPTHSR